MPTGRSQLQHVSCSISLGMPQARQVQLCGTTLKERSRWETLAAVPESTLKTDDALTQGIVPRPWFSYRGS